MVLTAGGAMRNASLFIGSNNASVQSNALVAVRRAPASPACTGCPCGCCVCWQWLLLLCCPAHTHGAPPRRHTHSAHPCARAPAALQWGLDFAPREQAAVAVGGAKGRYVIVFTGLEGEASRGGVAWGST